MKKVNILTKWFDSPNGRAFLFPLIQYRRALKLRGIDIQFFESAEALTDADVIMVESKYYSRDWQDYTAQVIENVLSFRQKANRVLYFDINDSSGWPHARILPYVDAYVKSQLLRDANLYLKPLYGHRLYTDFYHQHENIHDEHPSYSEVVSDASLLTKLKLGWNSGLADYSLTGPYRMALYQRIPFRGLLAYPKKYIRPAVDRSNDLSCRMGTQYARASVAWQRRQIQSKLAHYLSTAKISRRQYYRELSHSKVVISPFGLGEITLKDFEVFLTGGLLLKPDLSHMVTWPNWYQANETMVSYRWDLDDLALTLENILDNYDKFIAIAQAGQANYRHHLVGKAAEDLFCAHFISLIH
jgi:hypothetical protein